MFPSKYFELIFIILYFFIKSSSGGNHQPNGLEQFFGDQTNFLIKAKLSFEEYYPNNYDWISRNWLIEESVFGDEKNSIVTLISEEKGGIQIKVFRDFKTQTVSLTCIRKVWHLTWNLYYLTVTSFLQQVLLLGPYRLISYFANETTNEVEKLNIKQWKDGNSRLLFLKFHFSDPSSRILMRRKNSGRIDINGARYTMYDSGYDLTDYMPGGPMAVLSIMQIEPLESSMVSLPSKYIHYKFNESIIKYGQYGITMYQNTTNQHIVTLLDSASSLKVIGEQSYREVVHDYEFGLKYNSSGFNECTVELSNDEINYMTSEKYGIEFVKELYFPESAVESSSNKLWVKREYNKLIDNVEFDLVLTTYSRPVLELYESSRIRMNISDILKDFCVLLHLYTTYGSSEFYLIEVRKKCFTEVMELSAEAEWPQMITNMDNACFGDKNDKVILDLKISFLERSSVRTIQYFSSHIHNIKHELRRVIMDKLSISYLRINLIKFDFFDAYTIMAKVEIVESFVTYSKTKIQGTSHRFRIKSTEPGLHSSTMDECLLSKGSKAKNKFILTCKTGDYLCLGIDHEHSSPDRDKNGLNCMLLNNSDHSFTKLFPDVSLKEIRESYLTLNGSQFYHFDGSTFVVVNVTNLSPEKSASNISPKYFYLFTIFLFPIIMIFCLIMIILCQLCQPKAYALVDSVSLRAFNSRE
ncbi:uncharacterized protein LOC107371560 isoform X2 [Tetranychus urticae]|uniref:uncharacterized protein LOC107371560 isoform X2 n=1 Tax=Tetranychus urticae TaxID=32264 RepID=UPI000D65210E|nr:uncharacterized protein LOC107371560 isoform X2 [Tetranychus urticae]